MSDAATLAPADPAVADLVIRGQGPQVRKGIEVFYVSFAGPLQYDAFELSRAALDKTIEMLVKLRDGARFVEPVICRNHPPETVDQARAANAPLGSMLNPGRFDCLTKLEAGEPHFTLLGRDPAAARTVLFWAEERRQLAAAKAIPDSPHEREKTAEAEAIAASMEAYATGLVPADA
jgi:hypothetical protein